MKHIIWKGSFSIASAATVYWGLTTVGAGLYYVGSENLGDSVVGFVCIILGAVTLPVMVLLTAYLGRQAFRGE